MCQLGHVVCLVELGWIDLVDRLGLDLLLRAIVALYQYSTVGSLFHYPPSHEGGRGISQPDVALARKVVLALDDTAQPRRLLGVV